MRGCNHVHSTANKTQRDQTEAKQPNGSSGGFSPGTNAAFTRMCRAAQHCSALLSLFEPCLFGVQFSSSKTPRFYSGFTVSASLVNLLQISEEPIHEFKV